MKKQLGLTLVELMTVLALLGIGIALGAPHFGLASRAPLVTSLSAELSQAIKAARSEAMARGKAVTIGSINNNWRNGWRVWIDKNRNGVYNSNRDEMLFERVLNNRGLKVSVSPGRKAFLISSSGAFQISGSNSDKIVFEFCMDKKANRVEWKRFGQTLERSVRC